MIRVIVADDHPVMRSGIVQVLDDEPDISVVGEAADGLAAVEHPALGDCDVLVLDVAMPRLDGIGVLRVLADRPAPPRVLVLTADDASVAKALEAGATACAVKDAGPEALIDAVHAAAEGRAAFAGSAASAIVQSMRAPDQPTLTQRETDILRLVAAGTTNVAIADRLGISLATVKTHLQHAFERLGAVDRANAVLIARDAGIL